MTVISVKADIGDALKFLDTLKNIDLPLVTAKALTYTAMDVRDALMREMDTVFDAPTKFTRNSMYIKAATPSNQTATVQIKDRQIKYLNPEIVGGARNAKGFENLLIKAGILSTGWYAVPASGAPLDQYGNVRGGLITKILSQLQASRDSTANEPSSIKAKRNKRSKQGRYFAVKPGDTTHLAPGIYERLGLTSHSKIEPIFVFTPRAPKYRKRFNFYDRGNELAKQLFPQKFKDTMRRAIGRAR